jgi:hypothetical protein
MGGGGRGIGRKGRLVPKKQKTQYIKLCCVLRELVRFALHLDPRLL